jgi:simple sugar transport system ATP-binding protein
VLELTGIVKRFGSVQALRGADFTLEPGEVHALLGENGAGKSTLVHCAYGMISPDAGTIRLRGRPVTIRSPRDARALGIGMVHQHFTSIPALTVRENLLLALGPRGGAGGGSEQQAWDRAGGELIRGLDPDALVAGLGTALRQRLEIVKALATGARFLLLDEPSAVLTPAEVDELLAQLRRFAREGGAVAFITHKLPEVFAAAGRVTVLRHGAVALSGPVAQQSTESLAAAMLGAAPAESGAAATVSTPPLPVQRHGSESGPGELLRIGEIRIGPGELVGIAAVEGNGQRELLRTIAGIPGTPAPAVAVEVNGPVAFVPEDRTTEGLIPEMSITENVVLALPGDSRWTRGSAARIDWRAARDHAAWLIWSYGIRASGPEVPAGTLSGGNQQKVILARALESGPQLLIAENPTRGLDLRAAAELRDRLRAAAAAGVAVLCYSSDLDEVLELASRVLVVNAGAVREAPAGADRRAVGRLMLGVAN